MKPMGIMSFIWKDSCYNQLRIDLGNGAFKSLASNIKIEYSKQLKQNDLYAGRLPLNANEIVLSYGVYSKDVLNDQNYQDIRYLAS